MPAAKKISTTSDFAKMLSEQLRVSAGRPNLYQYEPHAKQLKFHSAPGQGRLYAGGNRSGKTTGAVVEACWWATGKHPYRVTPPPPVAGRVVGVDFLNGIEKIIKPQFAQWLPLSELRGGSWAKAYEKSTRTLNFANGSFIEFMSYDQELDAFAGTSRHFIYFDEEPPQPIFTENRLRLVDTAGSWWIAMTPVEGMDRIYDELYLPGKSNPDLKIDVIEVDMSENPHLAVTEIQAVMAGLSEDEKKARIQGKFVRRGGLVYKHFDQNVHVIDPMIPPSDWEWYASVDHGFNNPTAWLWHAVSPDGNIVTFAEHYESERTVDYHAGVIHARNAGFGRVPDIYVGDPAIAQRQGVTGTSIQTEYATHGVPIVLGNNDVLNGVNLATKYIDPGPDGKSPKWHVTRNCVNLINELSKLRWRTWASSKMAYQNNKHDAIHKKDDHACDSLRYFFTVLPDLTPVEVGAVPGSILEKLRGLEGGGDIGTYDTLLIKAHEQTIWKSSDDFAQPWDFE